MTEDRYCVYMHTSPSNKSYIGITSKNPKERKDCGYGNSYAFRNALKKYGYDNFKHEVLYEDVSYAEACLYEQLEIARRNTRDRRYGYNIALGGNSTFSGLHHTDETKEKIRKANTGRVFSDSHRMNISKALKRKYVGINSPNYGVPQTEERKRNDRKAHETECKIIECYDLSGNFIAEYIGVHEASRKLGISRETLTACLAGKCMSCGGFQWKTPDGKRSMPPYNKKHIGKYVCKYSTDGFFIEMFDSVRAAARSVNGSKSNISSCCKGIAKTAYGFIWKYSGEGEPKLNT